MKCDCKKIYKNVCLILTVALFTFFVVSPITRNVIFSFENLRIYEPFYSVTDKTYSGLEVSGDTYTTTSTDPKFIFTNFETAISSIYIELGEATDVDIGISVYYSNDGSFSSSRSESGVIEAGNSSTTIDLPYGEYSKLRVDIGNAEGITYSISDITIQNSTMIDALYWIIVLGFFAMSLILIYNYKLDKYFSYKIQTTVILLVSLLYCYLNGFYDMLYCIVAVFALLNLIFYEIVYIKDRGEKKKGED